MSQFGIQSDRIQPSRLARWGPALVVVGLLGAYFWATQPRTPFLAWGTDYAQALAEAAASDRQVVVAFHMPGCAPCLVMDRTVLRSAKVEQALRRFVTVRIDAMAQPELANGLGVYSTPTFLVVNPDQTVAARCQGIQPEDKFLGFLTRAALTPGRGGSTVIDGKPASDGPSVVPSSRPPEPQASGGH